MNRGNKMWIYELFFKNIIKKVLVMGGGVGEYNFCEYVVVIYFRDKVRLEGM